MYTARSRSDVESGYRNARRAMQSAPLDKPRQPLRVGVVGEFYTVMDAFSNLELEQKLADMRVEVHRWRSRPDIPPSGCPPRIPPGTGRD